MHWIALTAGCLAGALNYLMLAAGSGQLKNNVKRFVLFMLSGMLIPVTGLFLLAFLSPDLLVWFGGAAGGSLSLLAIVYMLITVIKKSVK